MKTNKTRKITALIMSAVLMLTVLPTSFAASAAAVGIITKNEAKVFLDENGETVSGLIKVSYDGKNYAIANKNNVYQWKCASWYYFTPKMQTGLVKMTTGSAKGKTFFFRKDGKLATGLIKLSPTFREMVNNKDPEWSKGNWYYFKPEMKTGYNEINNRGAERGDFSKRIYLFDKNGKMLTGFRKLSKDKTLLKKTDAGWKNGDWYGFYPYAARGRITVKGKLYLFDYMGKMIIGFTYVLPMKVVNDKIVWERNGGSTFYKIEKGDTSWKKLISEHIANHPTWKYYSYQRTPLLYYCIPYVVTDAYVYTASSKYDDSFYDGALRYEGPNIEKKPAGTVVPKDSPDVDNQY